MNTSSWVLRLWKPDVFAATNTWWRTVVKISSTSVCEYIPSMSSESIKCYRALELIGTSRFYYCDKPKFLWFNVCIFHCRYLHYYIFVFIIRKWLEGVKLNWYCQDFMLYTKYWYFKVNSIFTTNCATKGLDKCFCWCASVVTYTCFSGLCMNQSHHETKNDCNYIYYCEICMTGKILWKYKWQYIIIIIIDKSSGYFL